MNPDAVADGGTIFGATDVSRNLCPGFPYERIGCPARLLGPVARRTSETIRIGVSSTWA